VEFKGVWQKTGLALLLNPVLTVLLDLVKANLGALSTRRWGGGWWLTSDATSTVEILRKLNGTGNSLIMLGRQGWVTFDKTLVKVPKPRRTGDSSGAMGRQERGTFGHKKVRVVRQLKRPGNSSGTAGRQGRRTFGNETVGVLRELNCPGHSSGTADRQGWGSFGNKRVGVLR
jgi:hypothetical protein